MAEITARKAFAFVRWSFTSIMSSSNDSGTVFKVERGGKSSDQFPFAKSAYSCVVKMATKILQK